MRYLNMYRHHRAILTGPLQLLISNIDYDEYIGRIGLGRIERGSARKGMQAVLCKDDGTRQTVKIGTLFDFSGLKRRETDVARFGDIVAVAGIPGINIGETVCDPEHVEPLPFVKIDEPTVSMNFYRQQWPVCGKRRQIRHVAQHQGTFVARA